MPNFAQDPLGPVSSSLMSTQAPLSYRPNQMYPLTRVVNAEPKSPTRHPSVRHFSTTMSLWSGQHKCQRFCLVGNHVWSERFLFHCYLTTTIWAHCGRLYPAWTPVSSPPLNHSPRLQLGTIFPNAVASVPVDLDHRQASCHESPLIYRMAPVHLS